MQYLNSSSLICRIGYCEDCAKAKRPIGGQEYLVSGDTGFHLYVAERSAPFYGFSPHLYKVHKVIGQNVVIDMWCSVYKCGVGRKLNPIDNCWDYFPKEGARRRAILSIKDWNALVQYKNDFDYII